MDLLLTAVGLFLMSAMIQVAAAGALGGSAAVIEDAEDLAPMFAAVLGESGRIVLGLGRWAAVFTTYLAANTGYSLLVADIYSNVLAKRPELDESASQRRRERAFRWALAWFCISPLYVLATDWKPVWIVLMASALMAALLPLVVCILLWLTSRKRLLGERVNGLASNLAMAAIVATVGYLTYLNVLDWL
jgi:Mn2+/Fe2+ NRAMP family transporter